MDNWRSRFSRQARTALGLGSELPKGLHAIVLRNAILAGVNPVSFSMVSSNPPARPTKGRPSMSSFSPGASPITAMPGYLSGCGPLHGTGALHPLYNSHRWQPRIFARIVLARGERGIGQSPSAVAEVVRRQGSAFFPNSSARPLLLNVLRLKINLPPLPPTVMESVGMPTPMGNCPSSPRVHACTRPGLM